MVLKQRKTTPPKNTRKFGFGARIQPEKVNTSSITPTSINIFPSLLNWRSFDNINPVMKLVIQERIIIFVMAVGF